MTKRFQSNCGLLSSIACTVPRPAKKLINTKKVSPGILPQPPAKYRQHAPTARNCEGRVLCSTRCHRPRGPNAFNCHDYSQVGSLCGVVQGLHGASYPRLPPKHRGLSARAGHGPSQHLTFRGAPQTPWPQCL
eukprot:1159705-Pelagomonas_calceolata.AAC.3